MAAGEIERLVRLLARLPGLGPRSAQRAALAMLKRRDTLMLPLAEAMRGLRRAGPALRRSAAIWTRSRPVRDLPRSRARSRGCSASWPSVEDLWALERAAASSPAATMCSAARCERSTGSARRSWASTGCCAGSQEQGIGEVILALGATVDGQTTSHYLAERLQPLGCTVTRLGHGVPVGGELTYLDEGTLDAALRARQRVA